MDKKTSLCEYLLQSSNTWVLDANLATSNSFLIYSYSSQLLLTKETIKVEDYQDISHAEVIKKEITTPTKKTYNCKLCGKIFNQSGHLKGHTRVHTGEKPYKCKLCNKQFAQKDTLNKHIRVHTGEKTYKCKICLKNFTSNTA